MIDRRFFREAYDARRILLDVGDDARRLTSQPSQLVAAFGDRIRARAAGTAAPVAR